jgi:hypothetical protein
MTSQRSTTVEDFVLTKKGLSDLSRFITLWLKAHQIIRTSTDLKIANRYIERALTSRVRDEDKILFLTIALEALVSPNDRNELKNRNARAAALLAGINSDDRAKINKFIMECYDIRSKVAHGTFDSFRERDLKKLNTSSSEEAVNKLSWVVREVFLRRSMLLERNKLNREDVQVLLELAVFGKKLPFRVRKPVVLTRNLFNPKQFYLYQAEYVNYIQRTGDLPTEKWRKAVNGIFYPPIVLPTVHKKLTG